MRTIETNLYTFDELSPEAKERAVQNVLNAGWMTDYDWWDCTYDQFREDMKEHGITVDKIYFSGFWSQGDGACFTGHIRLTQEQMLESLPKEMREKFITFNTKVKLMGFEPMSLHYSARIEQRGNYSHSGSMYIVDDYNNTEIEETDVDCEDMLDEGVLLRDDFDGRVEYGDLAIELAWGHADDLYKRLREEYEYLTSEENVAEYLSNNDREFTEDGKFAPR